MLTTESCKLLKHTSWLKSSLNNITDLQKEINYKMLVDGKYKSSSDYNSKQITISLLESIHDTYVEFYGLSDEYKLDDLKGFKNECQ